MTTTRTAVQVLDDEFFVVRAKLIELASSLDRVERADGAVGAADPRPAQIRAAIEMLLRPGEDRAEQIQLLFSRPYEEDWQGTFAIRASG